MSAIDATLSHAAPQAAVCLHCRTPLASGARGAFCCRGCERVHAMLSGAGFEAYYRLRGDAVGLPVGVEDPAERDLDWLAPLEAEVSGGEGLRRVAVDVQGVHCAACVWLLGELFDRQRGGARCVVNPARGRIELAVQPDFALGDWVRAVEAVGYRLGPAKKERDASADDLTLRLGLSAALAMNTMAFSLAFYFGLRSGPVHELMQQLTFALGAASVLVGGSYFLRSAWRSLTRGLLHLDLPIAVGIVLAFLGSTWSFFTRAEAPYLDSLAVFIALMLAGRWLQERVLRANRARLLAADGIDGLTTRRVEGGRVVSAPCRGIERGDELMLRPGDLLPVDAEILDRPAQLRLDWILGESDRRAFDVGAVAPAGAFHASSHAVRVRSVMPFADSALTELLASPRDRSEDRGRFWDRVARYYVVGVLAAAGGAFALWLGLGAGLEKALSVTTAVLVVSCPCAFGIAVPLAQELAQGALRRGGLFVRTSSIFDRLPAIRQLAFDKTGTLTTGRPRLASPTPLSNLDADTQRLAARLASRSTHPKSAAVLDALAGLGVEPGLFDAALEVQEETGSGLQACFDGDVWRLGRPSWASPRAALDADVDLVLAQNGRAVAALSTEEDPRPDAGAELARLAEAGRDIWILSGDAPGKVRTVAGALGVTQERALGEMSPRDKADWIDAHGAEQTLFIGDGINDSIAAERAGVSGTPAIDRPFMPARTDFYFVTPGLRPIRDLLSIGARLRAVVQADLAFAVAYNLGAVVLAYLGLVAPWVAAVLMPASSLLTLTGTALAFQWRITWRS